jgi:hypothetical protein
MVDFDRVCEAIDLLQGVRRSAMAVHLEIHFAYLMLASDIEAVRRLPGLAHGWGARRRRQHPDYMTEPGCEAEAFMPHEAGKLPGPRRFSPKPRPRRNVWGSTSTGRCPGPTRQARGAGRTSPAPFTSPPTGRLPPAFT